MTDVILVRLGTNEKSQRFTFRKLLPHGAAGLWHLSANEKGLPCELSNRALLQTEHVLIGHFLKGHEFSYRSLREFFWKELSGYPRRYIKRDRAKQRQFNARTLVKKDRTTVLRIFVERTLEDGGFKAGPSTLMSAIYTSRWVLHPDENRLLNHYDLVLQSLESSGDLKRAQYGYEITAKAVATLSQYEEDDRRHHDNIKQQTGIRWLTAALVSIALLQAVITIWQEVHPDPVSPLPPPLASPPS